MKDFFYSLMTDRRSGGIYDALKAVLLFLSFVYGLAIMARKALYKLKIFERRTVPMKVISVGNLTLGGTGKTPFVVGLINMMRKELGREPAVLIRGYGWDESAMLKSKLKDTPILVGQDRAKSAHRAIRLYGSDTAILDDGFQHWELARDLDIVLVDSRNPFGNSHLFPRGVLRETRSALKRADVVVLTKVDSSSGDTSVLKSEISMINGGADIIEAVHKPRKFYDMKKKYDIELQKISGKRVVLLSAIGDPQYFEDTVRRLGAAVVEHIIFGDHHDYSDRDRVRIEKKLSERSFDLVVTTEKDAVKLIRMSITFPGHTIWVLAVDTDITSGREALVARLHSLYNG
jgi:tetraacyldisaccharide 4'-kinase